MSTHQLRLPVRLALFATAKARPNALLALVALVATTTTGAGCGAFRPRARAQASLAEAGKEAPGRFAAAEKLFRRGLYPEATTAFEGVRTEFPYSREATRSELRLADLLFVQGRYIESAEAYKAFVRFHAMSPEANYARFEAAESLYAQVPYEWWFMPAVAEKDQQILRQTIEAYDDLLANQPTERQAKRAQDTRATCLTHLARHELVVANFYARKGAHRGALLRAERLLESVQPPEVASRALAIAAHSAEKLGDHEAASRFRRLLAEQYPDSREAKGVHKQLDKTAG